MGYSDVFKSLVAGGALVATFGSSAWNGLTTVSMASIAPYELISYGAAGAGVLWVISGLQGAYDIVKGVVKGK